MLFYFTLILNHHFRNMKSKFHCTPGFIYHNVSAFTIDIQYSSK